MGKYNIEIDREMCVGDGLCCEEAPGTFKIDDEDKVIVADPNGDEPRYILSAARNCPLDAITLLDVDSGTKVWPEED